MTPQEEARERASLLIAWADGARFQRRIKNQWIDWTEKRSPLLSSPEEWRIKQEPRRMWETVTGSYIRTYCQEEADELRAKGHTVIEWQEAVR